MVRDLVVLVVIELQMVRECQLWSWLVGLLLAEAAAYSVREHARGSKFLLIALAEEN